MTVRVFCPLTCSGGQLCIAAGDTHKACGLSIVLRCLGSRNCVTRYQGTTKGHKQSAEGMTFLFLFFTYYVYFAVFLYDSLK